MKRILFYMSIMITLLCTAPIWGSTWYVDGWNGSDTNSGTAYNDAFQTIRRALNRCSNGDTIKLEGDLVEAPWDSTYNVEGNEWDKLEVTIQISVDKSNVTLTSYLDGDPVIYGYSPDSPDEHNDYLMRIDNTGNKIEDITFDGYYDDPYGGEVYNHDVVFMTPDADNTEISYCDFTNFGYEWHENEPDEYWFYGIVTGGWSTQDEGETLSGIKVDNNNFYENPFETQGAHEIYFTYTINSEVKYNYIDNNGAGHPLKLRDSCSNITFDNNTVGGAHFCFLGDYPESGEGNSSGIIVTNNLFGDPNGVIDFVDSTYIGPFYNSNNNSPFISEFSGNTIQSSAEFPSYWGKIFNVYAVTRDSETTYLAVYRTDEGASGKTKVYKFPEINGPVLSWVIGSGSDGFKPTSDMCVTGSFVIVCNSNGTNNEVYRYPKSGSGATAVMSSIAMTSKKVTALSSYTDSCYISAIKINGGSVKLYKGYSTQVDNTELKNCDAAQASEVTALACDGTYIVFAAKVGSDAKLYSFKEYTGNPADSALVLRQTWNNAEVTAMTFFGSTPMTAVKSTSTGNTTIYRGSFVDPDSGSESLGATEIISLAGYCGSGDFCYSIKNVSSDGDETMYFTDTNTELLQDILYYSRWWRDY